MADKMDVSEGLLWAIEGELILGMFLGALAIMAFYHLSLFGSIRDRSFLYYSLYLLAFSGSCLLWESGWAESPDIEEHFWLRSSFAIVDALAALAMFQFARSFLDTRRQLTGCDRVLIGFMVAAASAVPLSLTVTWESAIELVSLISLAGPIVVLVAGGISLRRGFRPARFLMIAFAVHLCGASLATFLEYVESAPAGLLIASEAVFYGGALVMVVLFSLALADRYNEQTTKRVQAEAENEALRIVSYKDGLTGIWNRRRLDEVLDQEWKRARRQRSELSMILMDVDHFKKYNDHYGHQAGDECLRQVAMALDKTAARAADLVARYGGEEFAVLVPDPSAAGAAQLAEEMREALARLNLPHEHSSAAAYVTVSVGVATCVPAEGGSPKDMIEMADQALYEAKESGRNRVCTHALTDGPVSSARQLEESMT